MEGNYYWVDLVAYWVRLNPLHLLQMCSSDLKSSISALKLFDISDVVSVIAQITGYQKNCRTHWLHKTPLCNHKSLFPRRFTARKSFLSIVCYWIPLVVSGQVQGDSTMPCCTLSYDICHDVTVIWYVTWCAG